MHMDKLYWLKGPSIALLSQCGLKRFRYRISAKHVVYSFQLEIGILVEHAFHVKKSVGANITDIFVPVEGITDCWLPFPS